MLEHLSLDEVIIKLKGWVAFRQYIRKKIKHCEVHTHKFADKTGHTYLGILDIYLGKVKNENCSASYNIVKAMSDCIKDINWY